MGRFSVEVDLANNDDLAAVRRGTMPPQDVRRARVRGVVDSGATKLVLPRQVALTLGLRIVGSAGVHYADGRQTDRELAGDIHLTYAGREGVFSAIIEPDRESALIGAIVLEDLDLIADCNHLTLAPRDPKQIISEVE